MALNNIIAPRQAVITSQGQPVAGGFVFLYEPGTTTFVTAYDGADLVQTLPQPVRLSGSGRANIWITRNADMVITDRNGRTILTEDSVNPDALGGDETSGLVPNGSFEIETAPPVPDGWVATDEAGSNNAVDSTESTDGANSYRFTSTIGGGGALETEEFFPVNDVDPLRVNFDMFTTLATTQNIVRVLWFDVTQLPISTTDVYNSTSNPTSWTEFQLQALPPALARFAKLELVGIDPATPLAASTYFDRIQVFYPTVVSGVFDNITIQDNEIISTNLNGEITLQPNGTGVLEMYGGGELVLLTNAFGDGITVRDFNTDGPTNPIANYEAVINFQNLNADQMGQLGWFESPNLELTNFVRSGMFTMSVTPTGGGGARPCFIGDPDDSTQLVHAPDASIALQTDPAGIDVAGSVTASTPPNNTDLLDTVVELLDQPLAERLASVGFLGTAQLEIRNRVREATLALVVRNASAAFREALSADPEGAVVIKHPETDATILTTERTGLQITPEGGQNALLDLVAVATETANVRARGAGGGVRLFVNSSGIASVAQTDAAGTFEENWLRFERNAAAELYYNGIKRAATAIAGQLEIFSDDSLSTSNRRLNIRNADDSLQGRLGFSGTDTLTVENRNNGEPLEILARSSGGTPRTLIRCDPTGADGNETPAVQFAVGANVRANVRGFNDDDFGTSFSHFNGQGLEKPAGFNVMPSEEQDANNVITSLDRVGSIFHKDSGTPNYTVNQNTTTPVGATWVIANEAGGDITLTAGTGVAILQFDGVGGAINTKVSGGTFTLGTGAIVTLYKYTDVEYWIWGSGITP